ncbi:MAG TPA: molecular chaperone TorD family protein [Streptosporangiaceae bacterium]|nr:molecular chaperone TorD family protein [Streptosporangiaceae bacterium]
MSELLRALAVLCEPPAAGHERLVAALELPASPTASEHTDLFELQLPPYASVHLGPEGMLGGEARDRAAGVWRALGLVPPAEPDHLATLLGLYATLSDTMGSDPSVSYAARSETTGSDPFVSRFARALVLHEHLLSWLDPWLAKVAEIGAPAYRAWGELLGAVLRSESERLLAGDEPLPAQLALAAPLEPPERTGGGAFLDALLAPARSGLILTRDDLARAARETGLALRVAERRYVLRNLMAQDAPATLGWLEEEARRAADRPARVAPGAIARHWQQRADGTARVLAHARHQAEEREVTHAR